jgi:hypothetical protein
VLTAPAPFNIRSTLWLTSSPHLAEAQHAAFTKAFI